MTADGLLLILGDGTVTGVLDEGVAVEHVATIDGCLARLASRQDAGQAVTLVAISPDVAQPFAVGRRLRDIDSDLGVAFIVAPADVPMTEDKLAFVPELSDAVVIPGWPAADLQSALLEAMANSARRARFNRALSTINQDLLVASAGDDQPPLRQGASERYLAALTRHAPDAILSVDVQGRVVTVNAAGVRILELAESDPEGQPLEALLQAEDPEDLHGMLRTTAGGEHVDGVELAIRRRDGRRALLSVTAAPVHGHAGEVAGSVFLARDVTEQRRTDERLQHLQRAEGLATLAGGVAHDFNNLLATVQGWVALAAADPHDTEMVAQALEHIQTASERAAELSRAMLAYGGRAETDLRPCDISDLAQGMQSLFAVSVPREIVIELDLTQDLPEVHVDDSQLRQVLMNLVTNAAEAIGDDAGTIRIHTCAEPRETSSGGPAGDDRPCGEHVVLDVLDSGPGMDEATATRIFDPFFTTKFAGRGLGLAASRGIVRAHGGTITVDTSPGAGARFRVTLPVVDRHAE